MTNSLTYKSGTPDSFCLSYIPATVIQSSTIKIPHIH